MKTNTKNFIAVLILFFSLNLSANKCSVDPSEDVATVHIYRPHRIIGFGWVFRLKVNNEFYDRVKNGKHLILKFKPGKTTFAIKKKKVALELEAGKTYYLRSSLRAGFFIGGLDLVEVTESFAVKEIKRD